jgi:hypothetical protein
VIHRGAINKWPYLPPYIQDEFIKAFSKPLMTGDPSHRIIEQEWLRLFIRMRSEIYQCPCGEKYFADPVNPNPCPECKKKNPFTAYIKAGRYNVAVHQRTRLYACHTEKDSEDFTALTGEGSAHGGGFELKNVSGKNWSVNDGGSVSSVAPGKSFTVKKGMTVNFGGLSAEIL